MLEHLEAMEMDHHTIFDNIPEHLKHYTWRPIRREDATALNRLLLEIEQVDQRQWYDTLEDRQRDYDDPGSNIETDTILALKPDGQAAGFGWIFAPPEAEQEYVAWLWGEVHPAQRGQGLGYFMLTWMEERARQIMQTRPDNLPHHLRCGARDNLVDRIALIEARGFEPVRSFYRMRRDLSQSIPEWQVADGIVIIPWQVERDAEALQVLNEAFRDHWGVIPVSQEIYQLFLAGHPNFRADLSCMAIDQSTGGAGRLIGLSLNKVNAAENEALNIKEGWIAELAVLREWRRQGIASALLCASMQAFVKDGLEYAGLGVDTENLSGALRIYERNGFVPINRNINFSKTV